MKLNWVWIVILVYPQVDGWWRRRRSPSPRNCVPGGWGGWSACSHRCGNAGTMSHSRGKAVVECCGGSCSEKFHESKPCNRNECRNNGKPVYGRCNCKRGWTGTCCEIYDNLCIPNPCQHSCTQCRKDTCVSGYTCSCNSCYTKLDTKCVLLQCRIYGRCYPYGAVNPWNQCQKCDGNNQERWSEADGKCSDKNERTRDDRCVKGVCQGTPYSCLPCEDHHNDVCRLKPGNCTIKFNNVTSCYRANTAKPGNSCQWCNPNITTSTWTNRNGISCDDREKCTRSDKCQNGQCGGISFNCTSLCQYCNGDGCSLHTGFGYVAGSCTCKIAGKDYNHQQINPNNECQWCDLYHNTSKKSSVWTNKPPVLCNDSNACTKKDLCNNGRCVGEAYSCNSSYPQSSCIQRSECVGDGACRDIMRNKGTICQSAVDKCDQPERCDGVLGTCPLRVIDNITIYSSQIALTLSNFLTPIFYQSTTDVLYLKLTGFSVSCGALNIKWSLLKSKDSCALGKNHSSLPNTINHVVNGLTLIDGETYRVVVQANDMRRQLGLPVCSNALTIDTSRPSGGWIRDGLGSKDVQFQPTKTISANWGGFKTTHGIGKYEVAVYNNNNLLLSFTNVNLAASFSKAFSIITDGSKISTKVRAYTKAGLYSEVSSNGVTIDTSRPFLGNVSDGYLNDLKYANWTTTYNASWTPFMDVHTPIVEYKLGVKKKDAGWIGSGLTTVGKKRAGSISGLKLASGHEYCAIVEGVNAAGLGSQATSDCLLIDHDAPKPGAVNDGTSGDIDHQSGGNVFHANWYGFSDGQKGSGIAEYKYRLVEKNDGGGISQWFSSGLQTKATITGLTLLNGKTYYIAVRAVDKVGNFIEIKSNGVSIDTSHPVYTGNMSVQGETAVKNGEMVVYVRSNESVTVSWPQFVDQHSGMLKYQWSIVERNEKAASWKDVPGVRLDTSGVLSSLSLKNNKEYRLTIRGINNAGLHADIKSPIIIPIGQASDLGTVSDGKDPTTDIDYQTNTSEVYATWKGFDTPDVKVRAFFYAVGSCVKGNYHVTNNQFIPVSPATATSLEMQGLNLVNGQRYCVKIKAKNLAGVQTEAISSDGFIVDVTPPDLTRAMVLDGSGDDDIDYQSSRGELFATWKGIRDYESGIHHFEVAVSRNRAGPPNVTSFKDVDRNMSAKIAGLNLNNDVYYIIVCTINNAGLRSCLASDGVLIDPTPSTSGVVYDGILEPDVRYQSSTTKISANWERIWDLESRVVRFEWGIEEEYKKPVTEFLNVGLQTHVTSSRMLSLRHGRNYTVVLHVYNRAGGMRELTSNGVTIDKTPPVPSAIAVGSDWRFNKETKTFYSSTTAGIYVTWEDFKEHESEIWYYKWAIGTSSCGTQIQPLINIGLSTRANTTGSESNFRPGVPYFVTVVARNRADLTSRACSSPLLFDYTQPTAGGIRITSSTGVEKSYFSSTEDPPHVSWYDFEDLESGIEKYEISVLQSNTSNKEIYALNSSDPMVNLSLSNLAPGTGYLMVINAINYAGLQTTVYSKPFIIDDTPPYYNGRAPRRHFQSDLTSVRAAWERFSDNESPVEFYEIGLGTVPHEDDIIEFTTTGFGTDIRFTDLELRDNLTYFITVRAYNAAGLKSSLILDEIGIDRTPPTGDSSSIKDGLSGYDIDFMSLNDLVSATWKNIEEQQSMISMFEYCVGTTPYNCLVKPFTQIALNKSFVCEDCKTKADRKVFARVRATNSVGLSTIFVSDGVTVDSSPPEIGRVLDGEKAASPDVEKVDRDWLPTITWYGVQDIESGIRECEWIVEKHDGNGIVNAYVTTLSQANITYNVRHTERLSIPLKLDTNARYVNVIRCSNNAGMLSYQHSNGWSVVMEWPVTSYVYDGLGSRDLEYDVIGESLGASWGTFYGDSKDPVIGYEWAVGTFDTPDNIMDFTEVGLVTRDSRLLSNSEIDLDMGVRYYVTVRATTLSGRTSNKSSNGFIVDTSAPTVGVVKVTHKILKQATKEVDYTLTWSGFSDSETGIKKFEFCLGYIENVCSTALTNAGLNLQGTVQEFIPGDLNTLFYGIVIATNNAGLTTIVSSDAIKIDFTPPIAGTVIDGLDEDFDSIAVDSALISTWSAFTDPETGIERCTLTVIGKDNKGEFSVLRMDVNASGSITHKFKIVLGIKYLSTIECRNPDGFKTSAESDGALCDGTPPIVGSIYHRANQNQTSESRYQSSTNALEVYWNLGSDPESGIKEYLVAVGSGAYRDDVRGFFTVGKAIEVKIANLSMNSGSTYYVTLEVVNNAGLKSRASSGGVEVDTTAPIITKVELQSSHTAPNLIGPGDYLTGNWDTYDGESDIHFTEFCIGTTKGGCQVAALQRVPSNRTSATCFECEIKHKHTYFMTVRVWNRAGLFSLSHTNGVTVDLTPPTSGMISMKPNYMPCLESCSLSATFKGFFDDESGIEDCNLIIKAANGESFIPAHVTGSANHGLASNLTLRHEGKYKIAFTCTNNLGEKGKEVESHEVRIDNSPPEKGLVIISPDPNHDKRRHHTGCHFLNTTLRVFWTGFHDDESDIAGFRVAIGRAPLGYDVLPFQNFNIDSEAQFELIQDYGLSKGDMIFATVEATNKAGLITKVSSPATRLLSDKDATLLNEGDFECLIF